MLHRSHHASVSSGIETADIVARTGTITREIQHVGT